MRLHLFWRCVRTLPLREILGLKEQFVLFLQEVFLFRKEKLQVFFSEFKQLLQGFLLVNVVLHVFGAQMRIYQLASLENVLANRSHAFSKLIAEVCVAFRADLLLETSEFRPGLAHVEERFAKIGRFTLDVLSNINALLEKLLLPLEVILRFCAKNNSLLVKLDVCFASLNQELRDQLLWPSCLDCLAHLFKTCLISLGQEVMERLTRLKNLRPGNRLQESLKKTHSLVQHLLVQLVVHLGQWRYNHVRKLIPKYFPQKVEVSVFSLYLVAFSIFLLSLAKEHRIVT